MISLFFCASSSSTFLTCLSWIFCRSASAVLDGLLEFVDAVAAGVADGHLGFLGLAVALLGQVAAALLGEGRDAQADHLAVVFGHDADVAVDDSLLNDGKHLLVPGLDGDSAGVGGGDGGHVVEGRGHAVIVDTYFVEDMHVGLAGADVRQGFLEMEHAHLHFFLAVGEAFLYVDHRDWGVRMCGAAWG